MQTDSHHIDTEEAAAFLVARQILKELESAGLEYPSIHLYSDGSCELYLSHYRTPPTDAQADLAVKLLHSERWGTEEKHITLLSCGGLVAEAKRRGYCD